MQFNKVFPLETVFHTLRNLRRNFVTLSS